MDSWGRVVWVFSEEEKEVTETHVELNLAPEIYYLWGESNRSLWQEKVVVQ